MAGKNKFGFEPLEPMPANRARDRAPGPMGAAVRDAAENLTETTEAKIEQRRKNAEDAKAFRAAQGDGRILIDVPLAEISTDDLPRDRLALEEVARSDEMEELKSSIRARGQKEPVEIYADSKGCYQLKKGWRRLTALRQLLEETGEARFASVVARVEHGEEDRLDRYVDMVEENVVREDLSFAEMAQVAITAAEDRRVGEVDASELVSRLYGALHKTKRSYIRSFVFLLTALGDSLKWPKEVSRNLGVDVSRALSRVEQAEALKSQLETCADAAAQTRVLEGFLKTQKVALERPADTPAPRKQKFEFFVGNTKVTARAGECRLVSDADFASVPRHQLEEAVKAFEAALVAGPRIR
ncbi:MAG: ParB N-terminal domain-containing protein [Pseudomonadota bacterium]